MKPPCVDDHRHGSTAGYVAGCREECCRAAWRINTRNMRTRAYLARGPLTIDGTGTRRRLRALVALGWSFIELDAEMGRKVTYCSCLNRSARPVLRATADEVAALYDRLSMTPRVGWSAERQRRMASSRGWPPPLAWDDIDNPDETPAEWEYKSPPRDEQLTDMVARGDGISHACHVLGITRKALEKWCDRNGRRDLFVLLRDREYVKQEYRNQYTRDAS